MPNHGTSKKLLNFYLGEHAWRAKYAEGSHREHYGAILACIREIYDPFRLTDNVLKSGEYDEDFSIVPTR